MKFDWDIRAVILTIAAFQAITVSGLLLFQSIKQNSKTYRLLAFFLLAMTAVLSEHIAGWLNLYVGQQLTYFPFGESFLFAPLAYLYVKSVTNYQYRFTKKDLLHFLPAGIYLTVHLFVWFQPLQVKQHFIDLLFRYKWQTAEGYGNAFVFTFYLYKIIRHFNAYLKWLPDEFSNTEKLKLTWVRNFIILLVFYYIVFIGFGIASLINWYGYKTQFWLYLMLAVTIYYISAYGYAHINKLKVVFDHNNANPVQSAVFEMPNPVTMVKVGLLQTEPGKEEDYGLTSAAKDDPNATSLKYAGQAIKEAILNHLQNEQVYLNPDLTLHQLSDEIGKPTYIITQVIKNEMGMNFNDLINSYRVDAVIRKIKQGEHKTYSLLGIAYNCGFNSKATFNRAFKKAKKMAPTVFIGNL
ncbi:MAG: helix-turn-helix domain-containing protein [Mucilaginibacter sp.]|nr:helix-turn-helix domain-containing protein [Mucilaginibacter sp.]